MADAHNHHYVPQSYLRGFAKGEGRSARVFTSDLMTGKSFTTLVRNVASVRDFNRIDSEQHDPNALEQAYGKFEADAAEALKRISASASITNADDWSYVLNLMALLSTRHPKIRATFNKFLDQTYRHLGHLMVSSPERWKHLTESATKAGYLPSDHGVTYEQVRDFVVSGDYDVEIPQNKNISLEISAFEAVLETLGARKWLLHVANDSAGDFVTSDNPVCLMPTRDHGEFRMGVGHGTSNTAILFPLTRRMAVVGTFEGDEGEIEVNARRVARLNSLLIGHAERQVYAFNEEFRYLKSDQIFLGRGLSKDPDVRRKQKT